MTITVRLYNPLGDFEAELEIPLLWNLPKVVLCGTLTYLQEDETRRYREVFAYRVPVEADKSESA